MRNISRTIILIVLTFICSGCRLLENATSNIGGWDVSACVSGFGVCWELFWDNSEKFDSYFAYELGGLTGETE